MGERIGILGGTFDPIHVGHLVIAEEVRWTLGLDMVYIVPAAQQPLKQGHHVATPEQRWEMVQLACADHSQLIPLDIELRRAPPSYTIDTLRELRRRHEQASFWFIIGSDALVLFPQWRAAQEIVTLTRLAAVSRPRSLPIDPTSLEMSIPGICHCIDTVDVPMLDISSSAIRQRIAEGKPVRYLLPDSVLRFIVQQQMYCTNTH